MENVLTKEQGQEQVTKLACVFRGLKVNKHRLEDYVLTALVYGSGVSAKAALIKAARGSVQSLAEAETMFNDFDKDSYELILGAYAKIMTEDEDSFSNFIRNAANYGLNYSTEAVFALIDPEPTRKRNNAQFGVHLEEIGEMFDECESSNAGVTAKMAMANSLLKEIAAEFKANNVDLVITNRARFGDSLTDQGVTLKGVGHQNRYKIAENEARVVIANMTKNIDGEPLWLEGGKWDKGPYFTAPVLAD